MTTPTPPAGYKLVKGEDIKDRVPEGAMIWYFMEQRWNPTYFTSGQLGEVWRDDFYAIPLSPDSFIEGSNGPTPSRYKWSWNGVSFDFYRLCEILGITHHAQAHALKKIIRAGRSIKSTEQDIDETIAALLRWKEMLNEDRGNAQ